MAIYKFVGPSSANEQTFIANYVKGKDVQFLFLKEGVEYTLTTDQVAMLPRDNSNNILSYFVQIVAPSTPVGLTATANGTTEIDLSWTATSGATSYNVYGSSTSGGTYTKINSSPVTTNSFKNTGLTTGTAYYYKITAVNSAGESAQTTAATATTA